MALELQRAGFDNLLILEKSDAVGGVWRENTYPGAGCDIPSPLYSLSSEPNLSWTRRFSRQGEILAYLQTIADQRAITPRIRFGREVAEAKFDESTGRWQVWTTAGEHLESDVLVHAVGQLSRPALPRIAGIDSFDGPAFHSAEWDHTVELTGKRVAVIGTGASAIQLVPAIAPEVAELTLFQRSAAWVLRKPDTEYKPWQQTMFRRLPATRLAERFGIWLVCEGLSLSLVDVPVIRTLIARLGTRNLHAEISDPALRAALTPDYTPGCKRALFSNDYYPALARPNSRVVTDPIAEITPTGIRTADGVLHEVDAIVYGTGFRASEFLAQISIEGAGGVCLDAQWRDGARAYLGMAVPGFPNMFILYGPNTNLGGNSIVHMLESQARYITAMVSVLAERPGQFLEVRAEVEERFDAGLQKRLNRSVWTLCSSWYRTASGRISNNWPGTVSHYRLRTRRPKLADYHLHAHTPLETGAR